MPSVLVIDGDATSSGFSCQALRSAGFEVAVAESGHQALELAHHVQIDVVLLSLRLPDTSGLAVLQELRRRGLDVPCVMVGGAGSIREAVEAIRGGAVNWVEPVSAAELVQILRAALRRPSVPLVKSRSHAAARWVHAILTVVESPHDPRTLKGWGRCAQASVGALRSWCAIAGAPARRSLSFGRVLRAVIRSNTDDSRFEDSLDVVDKRTLTRLLGLGRISDDSAVARMTVDEFLSTQEFITDKKLLEELRQALGPTSD